MSLVWLLVSLAVGGLKENLVEVGVAGLVAKVVVFVVVVLEGYSACYVYLYGRLVMTS